MLYRGGKKRLKGKVMMMTMILGRKGLMVKDSFDMRCIDAIENVENVGSTLSVLSSILILYSWVKMPPFQVLSAPIHVSARVITSKPHSPGIELNK